MNNHVTALDRKIDDAKELADFLGVSTATIRKMTRTTNMPRLRIGHSVRFDRQAVLEWTNEIKA